MELGTISTIDFPVTGDHGPLPFPVGPKAVKFDPIRVKEGDSFAVQSLGREKVGCQQNHRGRCRLEATKPVVFLPPKQLGSVRSKEFGTQLFEVFDSPAV